MQPRRRPFKAHGGSQFGHLNAGSTTFAAADYQYKQIDIYKYSPTRMTYAYSFNRDLSSNGVAGTTYVPHVTY